MQAEDLDLVSCTAYIQGKGKDDKELIYLQSQTILALENYIKIAKVGSWPLFKSLSNNGGKRLTTRAIRQEFKTIVRELKINKSVHGFRHYFIHSY